MNQFGRRNLSAYDRSKLALQLENVIKAKAKENQRKSGGAVPQKSAEPVETREELAKIAGVSRDTISKVKVIERKATPEQKAKSKGSVFMTTISKEMKELKRILNQIPADRQAIAQSLYNELEFMQKTLVKLREQVEAEGPTAMFKQGAQEFLREHPALKGYNTTVQRYSLLYKQFTDLLPKPDNNPPEDPLLKFIKE